MSDIPTTDDGRIIDVDLDCIDTDDAPECPWKPCGFGLCAEFGPAHCEHRDEDDAA